MDKASISELKNRLSAYLKKVQAGHTILVLDRDQPIARLEPVGGAVGHDDKLARLERAGLIRRAKSASVLKTLRTPAGKATRGVTEALLADRREGR